MKEVAASPTNHFRKTTYIYLYSKTVGREGGRILWHIVHGPRPAQIWRHRLTRKQTSQQVATVTVGMRSSYRTHYLSSAVLLQLINFGQNLYFWTLLVALSDQPHILLLLPVRQLNWFCHSLCLTPYPFHPSFIPQTSLGPALFAPPSACYIPPALIYPPPPPPPFYLTQTTPPTPTNDFLLVF